MSLWFPIMVNSKQIGEITITRRDDPISPHGSYTYDWAAAMFRGTGSTTKCAPHIFSGEVKHRYDDGPLVLISKVMAKAWKIDRSLHHA
ncbi:hypothetical protein MINTM005_13110 [Mycobacterium intracellulare]|uniref:hypothetical protein n=1 Tax=Mycobacterium intracellulare TaxID=1767 RepID=UPI001915D1BE|nr:hypothetical protein [Mycobacterium intracellulare]BCO56067.1 hypothetical protein MINTM005_13110 [Mycobacterium intracellulare]